MQTDRIKILVYETGREKALREAERFAEYEGFDHKEALRIRLLVEETLAMVSTITQDFYADFWLEGNKHGLCRIHLFVRTEMDINKKKELIAASKTKKNAAVKGLTGKIMELIENHLLLASGDGADCSSTYFDLGMVDMPLAPGAPVQMEGLTWSLESYRHGIDDAKKKGRDAEEAWDELEKSILGNLADDVKVAIRGNEAELIVEKKF